MNRKQRKRDEIRRKQREWREANTLTAIVVRDNQFERTTVEELEDLLYRASRTEIRSVKMVRGDRGE